MRRRYLIIVLGLLWVHTGFAQDKLSDLFSRLDGRENVTQVTITKSMLHMLPDMGSSVEMNGVHVKKIITRLDQIDIFTSEDSAVKKMMVKEATEFFAGNKAYEVLMRVKNGKENVVFYGKKDDKLFSSLVMFSDSESSCVLIRLLGKFTTQDIQDVTKTVKK
jgi:hypothetical protein